MRRLSHDIEMTRDGRTARSRIALTALAALVALGALSTPISSGASEMGSTMAGARDLASATPAPGEDVKYYVVKENPDGDPEFLFQIAERFLGDGNRFHDLFDLNEGRIQPNGRALKDAEVLEVGWAIQLPDEAKGDGIEVGPLPTKGTVTDSAEDTPAPAAPVDAAPASSGVPIAVPIGLAALGALLLAVAAFFILRRRTSSKKITEPFTDSSVRSDTSASWMIDRGLHVLVDSCARAGIELPDLYAVFAEGSSLRLKLTNPAPRAPEPWVVSDDAQSWTAPLSQIQNAPIGQESIHRFSRLVTLGVADSGRVLLNFDRARGPISVEGPTRVTHEVVRRWIGELTGNPWSDESRVVVVGNGLAQVESAWALTTLEPLLPELESDGRGILVFAQPPSNSQLEILAGRFASPNFSWIVIVLGKVPTASWKVTANAEGRIHTGFLPDVRATDLPHLSGASR